MNKHKYKTGFFNFILEKICVKFDAHKLKIFIDFGFIFIENLIIKLDKLLPYYLDFYREMIYKEISIGQITNKNNILHIGCGSIPATSILINDITNANITCIDNNNLSIFNAKNFISKIKNRKNIKIIHGEARNFPLKEYDIIIFSQGIKPYKESLISISKELNPNTKLIFRTSSDLNGDIKKNDFFIKDIFNIEDIIHHKKNGLLISLVLCKKK